MLLLHLCIIFSSHGTFPSDAKNIVIYTEPLSAVFYKVDNEMWVGSMNQEFFTGSLRDVTNKTCELADRAAGLPDIKKLREG